MTRTQSHAAGPSEAFLAGLEVVRAAWPNEPLGFLARELRTKTRFLEAWFGRSRAPIAANYDGLLRVLAQLATGEWPGELAERAELTARRIDPAGYVHARRWVEQERLLGRGIEAGALVGTGCTNALRAGAHIMPFLNDEGHRLLAQVDSNGCLDALVTWHATGPGADRIEYGLHRRGVHFARWMPRSRRCPDGHVLVAVDSHHRLRATTEVPRNFDAPTIFDAYQDLTTVLDVLDPVSTPERPDPNESDDDDEDGDGFDAGDVWKKGTTYDHRAPDGDDESTSVT